MKNLKELAREQRAKDNLIKITGKDFARLYKEYKEVTKWFCLKVLKKNY